MPNLFQKAVIDFLIGLSTGCLFVVFFYVGGKLRRGSFRHIPPIQMMILAMGVCGIIVFIIWLPFLLRGAWRWPSFPIDLQRTFIKIIGTGLGAGLVHWFLREKKE